MSYFWIYAICVASVMFLAFGMRGDAPGWVPELLNMDERCYVSRGGLKLEHALDEFGVDCAGLICADLGSHVGGFVDCLLQRGAKRVYSIDTSYGTLAWKLRKDERVVVLERTNALHVELPESVELVTIDLGWTRQELILPRARAVLAEGGSIITLIKPQYEADKDLLVSGVVRDEHHGDVVSNVLDTIRSLGFSVAGVVPSPIKGHGGNREVLALLK